MKWNRLAIAFLAAAVAMGTSVFAGEEQDQSRQVEVKKQTLCPVMDGKINKDQFVDVKGYRIYVCCAGCKKKIKADPDTYIEKMKAEGVTPEKAPKKEESKEDN